MCTLIHDLKSHCPNFACSPVKQSVDTETGTFKITLAGYWMFFCFFSHSICFTLLTLKDPIKGEGGFCSLLCPCHLFFHHSVISQPLYASVYSTSCPCCCLSLLFFYAHFSIDWPNISSLLRGPFYLLRLSNVTEGRYVAPVDLMMCIDFVSWLLSFLSGRWNSRVPPAYKRSRLWYFWYNWQKKKKKSAIHQIQFFESINHKLFSCQQVFVTISVQEQQNT